jgi:AraC-like DNA-binding protein
MGRGFQIETGSGGPGAIAMGGAWSAGRTLRLPGGTWVKLRLQLSGRTRLRLGGSMELDTSRAGIVLVHHPAEQAKLQVSDDGASEHSITLRFPLRADGLPAGFEDHADGPLHAIFDHLRGTPRLHELPLPPELAFRARALLNPNVPKWAEMPVTLARVEELSWLALTHLERCLAIHPTETVLSRRDRRRVAEAREILETSLAAPPSLATLARRVGLNRNTLNRGFRDLYGETVFALLRRRRLELARDLLRAGHCSLAEAAAIAGFRHTTNFSSAYRALYGVSPSRDR